ncbi:MAG: hypothetical protein RSA22_03915 [Acinetobacter sp.]
MKKVLLVVALTATVLVGCSKQPDSESNNENMTQPAIAQPVAEEKSDAEKGAERILSKDTLTDVIEMVKPTMSDEFDAFPASAGVLAFWMENKHTKIGDIRVLDSSTRGKILKDSFNERGKRLCVSGTIVEIQVDRSGGFPSYHAGLASNYTDFTRVLAVGSTGELVANSSVTFCGVVIGKIGFNNAIGGTTNAPYLVGMFDLPENR